MKMNDVKNKKVVSALMIGISAMMALQTPITAYASGDGIEPQPDSQPTTEHSSEASTSADAGSSVQQEVSSASDAADAAVESVVGEQPAPAPVVEAPLLKLLQLKHRLQQLRLRFLKLLLRQLRLPLPKLLLHQLRLLHKKQLQK